MAINKDIKAAQAARIAALAMTGASQQKIADSLGMARSAVRTIINSPEYSEYLKRSAEASLDESKAIVRSAASELAKESIRVLLKSLRDDDSLEAVKISLKVLGLDKDDGPEQNSNITVVMPGAELEKSIEVESTTIEEE